MSSFYRWPLALILAAAALAVSLSSCVWKYVPPTHNTPCFTDKKQFEGSAGANINGGNINLAYSPLKYFSVQLNGYSSLTSAFSSSYNTQLEAALGAYLPTQRFIFGLTAGYGAGLTNWHRIWYSGDAYTPLKNLQFETSKYYIQHYTAYRWRSSESFAGVSAKVDLMKNHYSKAGYSYYSQENFTRNQYSFELVYFIKMTLGKKLYTNFCWGLHLLNNAEGDQSFDLHPVGQVGLTLKL